MRLYQAGNVEAFHELYSRYSKRVYGYFLRRGANEAIAGELFQVVFMKLHKSRDRYLPHLPFAPWIFTLCRSTWLDHLRAQSRSVETVGDIAGADSKPLGQSGDNALGDVAVQEAWASLSSEERALVEQRFIDGSSFEEMSRRLLVSPSVVRQRVSRISRKLKGILGLK
jgi:RNA polymerase sigma-70 factor (ECF subfamily)